MRFLRLLPVFISFLLLAAHFIRSGQTILAMGSILILLVLMIRKAWVPRVIQLALLFGAVEWLRTIISIAQIRMEFGILWTRMALILGAVALFTGLSGFVFRNKALQKRFSDQLNTEQD